MGPPAAGRRRGGRVLITLFTIPKPFRGHFDVIQRNAIESWTRLGRECEIFLLGNDEGVAEAARNFGAVHLPEIRTNQYGTPLVSSLFEVAENRARHPLLCYVNTDIILFRDFLEALARVRRKRFLMLGQRWNLDVERPIDFGRPDWEARLRAEVAVRGELNSPDGVDYYAYTAGLFGKIPPFAVGRTRYDNWLIYRARSRGIPVIDATTQVFNIHQNHERTYTSLGMEAPDEEEDLTQGLEARENHRLAGGWDYIFTLRDATWKLGDGGLRPRWGPTALRRRLEAATVLHPWFGRLSRTTASLYGGLRSRVGAAVRWVLRRRRTG